VLSLAAVEEVVVAVEEIMVVVVVVVAGSWWLWLKVVVVVVDHSDATLCDRICRSWKFRSIRIAILNLFQCLPQIV
jgi:hypothetical protein